MFACRVCVLLRILPFRTRFLSRPLRSFSSSLSPQAFSSVELMSQNDYIAHVRSVNAEEAQQLMISGDIRHVFDVRLNRECRKSGLVAGSKALMFAEVLADELTPVTGNDFDAGLMFVSMASDARSKIAADRASELGYRNLFVLDGGFEAWLAIGGATEKFKCRPFVKCFFEPATYTCQFVVVDLDTKKCAIVDPVMDYDPASGRATYEAADEIIAYVREENLEVEYVLDTHAHADHLSAVPYIREHVGGKTGIGKNIELVQTHFNSLYNSSVPIGEQWDLLFADGDSIQLGNIEGHVIHTPGHTPACMSYVIGDAVFCGDTIFMPDYGTARCDFPKGDARTLWNSIQRLLSLPRHYRIYVGHDYQPGGRAPAWETTVHEQIECNIHVGGDTSEETFVENRNARDKTLKPPRLILPSLQVNIRGGQIPESEDNGISYLKIPVNVL